MPAFSEFPEQEVSACAHNLGDSTRTVTRSRRVTGIEVGRSFLFALFRHHRGARAALLTAPAQTLLRDVVFARPAIFPSLTDESLLANGLSHSLRPCELRRCACRRYIGTCAAFIPCLSRFRRLGKRA